MCYKRPNTASEENTCPWGHLQAKCDGFLSRGEFLLYTPSIAPKILNTWPVLLFPRHVDLPWKETRNISSLSFHQRVKCWSVRSSMLIKIQSEGTMMLDETTENHSLPYKLKFLLEIRMSHYRVSYMAATAPTHNWCRWVIYWCPWLTLWKNTYNKQL